MHDDDLTLQRQLEGVAGALSREFASRLRREDVDRCLGEELEPLKDARVTEFVPILAERRTRSRLRALADAR